MVENYQHKFQIVEFGIARVRLLRLNQIISKHFKLGKFVANVSSRNIH